MNTSSTSGATGSPVDAAKAFIAPYATQPTSINISKQLNGKPASGKKVVWIATDTQTGRDIAKGLQAACAALGWSLQTSYWQTNPADANTLMIQAVQQGADYIVYQAVALSIMQTGIAAANAKGVGVFGTGNVEAPTTTGVMSNVAGSDSYADTYGLLGKINAAYIIAKTGGNARAAMFSLPTFAVVKAYAAGMQSEFAKICPTCTFDVVSTQYSDLSSGRYPALVVGYLRSHPRVDNITFAFGQATVGVAAALKTAGIKLGGADGVQVTGQNSSIANLQSIIDGGESAWVEQPQQYKGWLIIDAMARAQEKMDLTVNWKTTIPVLIRNKTNTPPATHYEGPTAYQDQFKALWKVS